MKFRHIIFLLILGLTGCKKQKNTIIIEGTLLNPVNNQGLGGVSVDLSSQQPVSGTFSIAYNTIEKQTTTANGSFRFEFTNSNASSYRLSINHSGYYLTEEVYSPSKFPVGEVSTVILPLYAKGALRVNVKNTNPFDSDDKITFQISSGAIDKPGFCMANTSTFTGVNVDTTLECLTYGYQKTVFKWFVTKNNVVTALSDSLNIPFNDTAVFDLNY